MNQEPKDMLTSDLVREIQAFWLLVHADDKDNPLTQEDWTRQRAVAAELDRRVPK